MARMLAQGQLLKDYKTHLANPVPLPHTGQAVPAGYDQGENPASAPAMTDYTKKIKNTAIVAAILGESLPQYLTTAVLTQRQDTACEM